MVDAVRHEMTTEEFLAWEHERTPKHELVDGLPRMMSGGTRAHSLIQSNMHRALRDRLHRGPCRPWSADLKVAIPNGNIRYPDVSVDCGRYDLKEILSRNPVAVVEVLSHSTRRHDFGSKLPDYQRTPSVMTIVYLEQDAPIAQVWTRDGDRWISDVVTTLDGVVPFRSLGVEIAMADIFEDVDLPPDPEAPATTG